ncbi:MAG: hypothetical protein ACRCT8_01685 [Lacipirellulaceae bacterium]
MVRRPILRILLRLLLVTGCAAATSSPAAQLYQLIDYPELQRGYTLSGTIEVSDDAATDGTLTAEEVLDWQWRAEGPLVYTGQFRTSPILGTPTIATGIEITEHAIYLPANGAASLNFQEYTSGGRASTRVNLGWQIFNNGVSAHGVTGIREGDIGYSAWARPLPLGSRWQIAVAVPEPTTVALTSLAACCLPTGRSRGR